VDDREKSRQNKVRHSTPVVIPLPRVKLNERASGRRTFVMGGKRAGTSFVVAHQGMTEKIKAKFVPQSQPQRRHHSPPTRSANEKG
jgi:hypothetical protein